jgi:Fe-S oxidoreductase
MDEQSLAEKHELFVCVQCGRCTAGCPVNLKGPLNIRRLLYKATIDEVSDAISEGTGLWDCTLCSTCGIRCPRGLKPNEVIIGLRNILVEEGHIPPTIRDALEGVFKHGNPWGRGRDKRSEWATGLGMKNLAQSDGAEILYFAGCAPSYDPRAQEVARALAKSFCKAGVDFGILGNEESCCGSEVRRMGEEGLFQLLVEENSNLFRKYGVKKIVTTSPHCYNTFKNEYPLEDIEVKHYTQYIADLMEKGRLTFSGEVKKVVTYHDPCFLGKQNRVFDEPRRILTSIPGVELAELDRSGERSLCCEGGGGRMWVEASDSGERLAEIRVRDAVEIGAEVIATACPFCLLTLEDAVKTLGYEERLQVRDIMELVSVAL